MGLKMCTKAEVKEAIQEALKGVEANQKNLFLIINEVKGTFTDLPCQASVEKIIRAEMRIESLEKLAEKCEKEKNEEVYPRLRDCETGIATLTQQNKDQDGWSVKTWGILMMVVQSLIGIGIYLLVRS